MDICLLQKKACKWHLIDKLTLRKWMFIFGRNFKTQLSWDFTFIVKPWDGMLIHRLCIYLGLKIWSSRKEKHSSRLEKLSETQETHWSLEKVMEESGRQCKTSKIMKTNAKIYLYTFITSESDSTFRDAFNKNHQCNNQWRVYIKQLLVFLIYLPNNRQSHQCFFASPSKNSQLNNPPW